MHIKLLQPSYLKNNEFSGAKVNKLEPITLATLAAYIPEKYKVTIFYTAPTAIRMLMKVDGKWTRCFFVSGCSEYFVKNVYNNLNGVKNVDKES